MSQKMISCKTCGKEIAASAKNCPECGAKNKKPIYKKWWVWAIVAIVFISAISSGGGGDKETSATTASSTVKEEVVIEYTDCHVNDLMADLNANALKAKETYNEQNVSVTGRLSNIDSSGKYINILPTDDAWAFTGVQCYIKNDEQRAAIMEMSIDDIIVVKGKITDVGEFLGYSMTIDSLG